MHDSVMSATISIMRVHSANTPWALKQICCECSVQFANDYAA